MTYVGCVGYDESVGKCRSLRGQTEGQNAAPIVGNNISAPLRDADLVGLEECFPHRNDELGQRFEKGGIVLVEAIAAAIARQINADVGSHSQGYSRLLQEVFPHDIRIRKAMDKDDQVARLWLSLLIAYIV